MSNTFEINFQVLFENLPGLFLILDPQFNMVAANNERLQGTMTSRDTIGRPLFEVFPDNPDDVNATGTSNLRASLNRVLATRKADSMAVQKYDIRNPDGSFEEKYWSPVNTPILNDKGEVVYIIHQVEDVTEFVRLKQQSLAHEELKTKAGQMEAEIMRRAQEIQETNKQLRILNEELSIAKEAALSSSRLKSEFLANMSHEIRTPMNGVLGLAGLMLETKLDSEQMHYTTGIRKSAESLLTIINDILDFSKIEAGKLLFEEIDFQFQILIQDIREAFMIATEEKGLSFVTEVDPKIAHVLNGDPGRLQQVLRNLISNAIKFTQKGTITLRAKLLSESNGRSKIRFEIQDTGIGISPEAQAKLFEKFSQADQTVTRRYGGTGLGLSICKNLIHIMDGEIGLNSEVNEGTTFWFTAVFKIGDTKSVKTDQTHNDLPQAKLHGRVLVAEDNATNQLIALKLLAIVGCHADVVGNGLEAINAFKSFPYDLILMDCQMPELDGFDATKAIREIEKQQNKSPIPIIALTASAMSADKEICLQIGMTDYLTKPVNFHRLWSTLEKWLPKKVEKNAP